MADTKACVQVDSEVLSRVDAAAARLGRPREQVVQESLRRGLAASSLGEVLAKVRTRSSFTEEEAAQAAYEELKDTRAQRRGQ